MEFKNIWRILIVAGLIMAVAAIISFKKFNDSARMNQIRTEHVRAGKVQKTTDKELAGQADSVKIPKLLDLGADKCIPCKMMAPLLEELKKEFADRFDVEFIDVWKNPDAGGKYGVSIIPMQIFYDASGKELFRHEGFFPKADILRKWKEFGLEIKDSDIKAAEERDN